MNTSKGKKRRIHCYRSSQKILLVGEGDFSFSACLARAFRTAKNIVATSYLDKDSLVYEHWTSVPHLKLLKNLGCLLLYEVDVYEMHKHPILKKMKFDIIIFNFPHAGHYDYLCERDLELIEMHQELVGAYFRSASKMVSAGGEVHLRHRDDFPYNRWNVVLLAGEAGLELKEKVVFEKRDYVGYHNKRRGDVKTNKTFPISCAFTFKFAFGLPKVEDHDEVHNTVHVLDMKDEVQNQQHPNINEVHDDLRKKEVVDDDLYAHVFYFYFERIYAHILEMKDNVSQQHANNDEVCDGFCKNDGVEDDPSKNDGVEEDISKNDGVPHEDISKNDGVEDDLPKNDGVPHKDLSKNYEGVPDDLYKNSVFDVLQEHHDDLPKTDGVEDDLPKNDKVSEDLLKTDGVPDVLSKNDGGVHNDLHNNDGVHDDLHKNGAVKIYTSIFKHIMIIWTCYLLVLWVYISWGFDIQD